MYTTWHSNAASCTHGLKHHHTCVLLTQDIFNIVKQKSYNLQEMLLTYIYSGALYFVASQT